MEPLLPFSEDESSPHAAAAQTVVGTVESIVFASDDGQYTVLRVTDQRGRQFTMIGSLSGLTEGEDVEARGTWEKHKEYGRQFRVSHFKAILPRTEMGIRRYLASGVVHGIGKVLAGRIVDKFGTDTLNILDQYSSRLKEVEGVGKKRIAEIKTAWTRQSAERERAVYLQGLGVSAAYCRRIDRHFGDSAVDIIRENPYRLTEVRGIGFRMADAVAKHLGIAKDHLFRLAAGCVFVMEELASGGGHCCAPEETVVERAKAVLEVEQEAVERGIDSALVSNHLVRENDQIYLARLHRAECELAQLVLRMPASRLNDLPTKMPVSPAWRQFNEEQQQAVRQAFRHGISIITGGPGVGKTTVIREIVHVAQKLKLKVGLAAPTGRAAKRMSEACGVPAKTIHRLLKWQPDKGGFYYGTDHELPVDMLIIDEMSMVDLQLAVSLMRAVNVSTRLVLVGDRDQLPSVGPGNVLGDLIESGQIAVQQLTQVYRQAAGSAIITNAHRVNKGELPDLDSPKSDEVSRDFYWIEQDDPEKALQLIQTMVSERIPKRFGFSPLTDIQVLTPMNRGVSGAQNANLALKALLNPKPDAAPSIPFSGTRLTQGDRVMQIVNNYDLNVFNGDLGVVQQVFPAAQQVTVRFEAGDATYSVSEAMEQLRFSYAITIHKSQGSEFPAVIVPILTSHFVMLQRNLLYTAMTRAKKLLVIVGAKKALSMAVRNFNRSPRHTRLAKRIKG